jgi:Na+(H+)/acetate symporter ActP
MEHDNLMFLKKNANVAYLHQMGFSVVSSCSLPILV